jgi:hypothetical protein
LKTADKTKLGQLGIDPCGQEIPDEFTDERWYSMSTPTVKRAAVDGKPEKAEPNLP